MLFKPKLLVAIFLFYSFLFCGLRTETASNNTPGTLPASFSVLACVTWWSHDAVGYHPAMSLFLENTSGHEITGAEIPFQGRFTDVRTGDVTVSREYRRGPIHDHQRLSIFFRGPRYYELPIDSSLWPTIECKAMCRLNNTDVEDLFMTHLAQVTMSDEEAQAQLIAQAGRNPLLSKGQINKKTGVQLQEVDDAQLKSNESSLPLHASAGAIGNATTATGSPTTRSAQKKDSLSTKKTTSNAYPKLMPGLGSDFYAFDKLYGDAAEVQASPSSDNLTWTHYKSTNLVKDVFVGSRNANKADVIIVVLGGALKDKALIPLAKLLVNCAKREAIVPFSHSVRYLPAGRSEILTTAIRENRILAFQIQIDTSINTVLVASRLPGDMESALSDYCRHVNFLHFLQL